MKYTNWSPLACVFLMACATVPPQKGPDPETSRQIGELNQQLSTMSRRIEDLETRLSTVAERAKPAHQPVPPALSEDKVQGVSAHPADSVGAPVEPLTAATDPEAGFSNDEPVRKYRQALILFQAGRYPDAILAFSSFVENFPDHPLAGSAQYHVGESYYKQGEYKLSIQEFQRVLTSYDRSAHVADSLRDMADAEDRIKRAEEAARHRQLLTSLFPHSPAAVQTRGSAPPTQAPPETTPVPAPSQGPDTIESRPITAPMEEEKHR